MISAKGSSASPQLSVYLTTGDSLTIYNYRSHKNVSCLIDQPNHMTTYIISNPPEGIYYTWSPNADSIHITKTNQAPKIAFSNVVNDAVSKQLQVQFNASDPDDDAQISFGFDNDKNNANGIMLVDSISENNSNGNINLDYSNLKTGIYYMYASITDAIGQNYYVYDDAPIKIISNSSLNTPTGLTVTGTGNSLIFRFDKNNSEPLNYLIHYSNSNNLNLNSAQISIGDHDTATIIDLPPGRNYDFAVSAIDSNGDRSDLSNTVSIEWMPSGINNFPTLNTNNIIHRNKVNNLYEISLQANDPDGDALTYSIVSGPANAQISNDGLLTWIPNNNNLGYNQFSIKVEDGNGGFDSAYFEMLVYDTLISSPIISFNQSGFDSHSEKGIIEVTDPILTPEDNISNLNVHVSSTSDPVGINVSTSKIGSTIPTFSYLLNFTEGNSSPSSIKVKNTDTVWVKYTSTISGLSTVNYSLFNYLNADYIFKDSICNSESIKFFNASKGSNLQYKWDFGDNSSTDQTSPTHVFPKRIGIGSDKYNVRLLIKNSQGSTDTINKTITVFKTPGGKIVPAGATSFCKGDSLILTAEPAETYKWSSGSNSSSVTVNTSGTYSLVTSNGSTCASTDRITINVIPPPLVDAGKNSSINFRDSLQIGGTPTARGSSPFKYKWEPLISFSNDSIPNPIVKPMQTTSYKVVVKDAKGCSASDSVLITVKTPNIIQDEIYLFPNPAGSYINIEFILSADYKTNLTIYDMQGRFVKWVINNQHLKKGYHFYRLSLNDLSTGVYQVIFNDKKFKKFIKQ